MSRAVDLPLFSSSPNTGEIYNVIAVDNLLNTSVAYAPFSVYFCEQFVDAVLQYGSPCKPFFFILLLLYCRSCSSSLSCSVNVYFEV